MSFRVSVVMPVWNAGRTVGAALASAAAQTLPPHEILVVDDGSNDDSVAVVRGAGVDARLLSTPHVNAAAARNAGIAAATGDWIAFLDADDLWLPHHLARAAETLAGTNDVAYMAHWERFGDHGPVAQFAPLPVGDRPVTGLSHQRFFAWFARWRYFCHSGCVERRDVIDTVGRFDETQVARHDFELFMRVIHGRTWAYDPRVGWRYRADNPAGLSRRDVDAQYYFLRAVLKHRRDYAGADMETLLRGAARKAMAVALTDGDAAAQERAFALAEPLFGMPERTLFGAARRAPWAFRAANRLRRRLIRPVPGR